MKKNKIYPILKQAYRNIRAFYRNCEIFLIDRFSSNQRENIIVCMSMYNNCYGGSPKAFSDYVLNTYGEKYKVYWAFSHGVNFDTAKDIHKLRVYSWEYYRIMKKCKYVVSDFRLNKYYLPFKTDSQIYVQTWHGTALKRIERDVENTLDKKYVEDAKWDSQHTDIFIAGSKYMADLYRSFFWYDGEVSIIGTPRNDCFYRVDEIKIADIKKKLKIEGNSKVVMFAPTFRKGIEANIEACSINADEILDKLTSRFGGNWTMVCRFHPVMVFHSSFKKLIPKSTRVVDATLYPDMQELLEIADVLITDYSSSFFDFSLTLRPCFLFGKDYLTYNRGFLLNLDELPYLFAKTEKELYENIENYEESQSQKRIRDFNEKIGMAENGDSCTQLAMLMGLK